MTTPTNPNEIGSKSVDGIEKRARELLAVEFERDGLPMEGGWARDGSGTDSPYIRAITAALRSAEQPSTQPPAGFMREHGIFVYDVDFGDEGRQQYVRLEDFNRAVAKLTEAEQSATTKESLGVQQPSAPKTPDVSDAMVRRFLAWRLPGHIKPDGVYPPRDAPYPMTGTNLLDYDAAKAMLEWVLMDMSPQAQLQRVVDEAFRDDDDDDAPPAPRTDDAPREEMSPDFTDSARAAIAWVLYHHQGGSSAVGQPLRFALGMGATEPMPGWRIAEAKRWADMTHSKTADFHAPREAAQERLWKSIDRMLSDAYSLGMNGDPMDMIGMRCRFDEAHPAPQQRAPLRPVTDADVEAACEVRAKVSAGIVGWEWADYDEARKAHIRACVRAELECFVARLAGEGA